MKKASPYGLSGKIAHAKAAKPLPFRVSRKYKLVGTTQVPITRYIDIVRLDPSEGDITI